MTDGVAGTAGQSVPTVQREGFGRRSSSRPLLVYDGSANDLLGIVFTNFLLNLVTLGIYRFWARTRVRQYLWNRVKLDGDRFEYTGTGSELFIGFLIVTFAILMPYGVITQFLVQLFADSPEMLAGFNLLAFLVILWLVGIGLYRARRYRLSRTRWRGIRATLEGSSLTYGFAHLGWLLSLLPSLLWTLPGMRVNLARLIWNDTYFGGMRFRHEGGPGPLYRPFAVLWGIGFAGLIVIGLFFAAIDNIDVPAEDTELTGSSILMIMLASALLMFVLSTAFLAREFAYLAQCISLGGVKFRFTATKGDFAALVLGNVLIVLLTLGIGLAFTQHRVFRFACAHLECIGELDYDAIVQSAAEAPRFGEGLADAFDVAAV